MTQKIIDDNGNIIKGMYRSRHGQIVVDDKDAYYKYKRDKGIEARLDHQDAQIAQMKNMLEAILYKLNESK